MIGNKRHEIIMIQIRKTEMYKHSNKNCGAAKHMNMYTRVT